MFQAAKEAQSLYNWLLPFLPVLGEAVIPIPIFNDNDGASALALDPVGRFKNKHIRMEHHYTQEQVAAGVVVPVRVDTSENKSDLLTKALGPQVFPGIAQSLVGLVAPSTFFFFFFDPKCLLKAVTRETHTPTHRHTHNNVHTQTHTKYM